MDARMLTLLYKCLVHPHLEYANIIRGPFSKKDQVLLKRVQRMAITLIPSLCDLSSYETRMKKIKLPSLKYRRKRGAMLCIYKLVHRHLGISKGRTFPASTTYNHSRASLQGS